MWNSLVTGEFPDKGQRRGALVFSSISAWINDGVNNRDAGDLRCHRTYCDVTVMEALMFFCSMPNDTHEHVTIDINNGLLPILCTAINLTNTESLVTLWGCMNVVASVAEAICKYFFLTNFQNSYQLLTSILTHTWQNISDMHCLCSMFSDNIITHNHDNALANGSTVYGMIIASPGFYLFTWPTHFRCSYWIIDKMLSEKSSTFRQCKFRGK